jgi:hypothetical protein
MAHAPLDSTLISVDIGVPSLIRILKNLNAQLTKSGTGPLSIYILGTLREQDNRTRALEAVAVDSVLKLLRTNMHRVNTLVVHTHLRSSLLDVDAQDGPGRVVLYYDNDDLEYA